MSISDNQKHCLYIKDCVKGTKELPDESLDLILTSPPYFDFIVYSQDQDNLSTKKYRKFLLEISQLWTNMEPKLKKGGVVALWLHDVYKKNDDYFKLFPLHADLVNTFPPNLELRNILIWDRYLKKTMPDPPQLKSEITRFQYILLFSKSKTRYEKNLNNFFWDPFWYYKTCPKFLGSKLLYRSIFQIGKIPLLYKILNSLFFKTEKIFVRDEYVAKEYTTACPEEVVQMIVEKFSQKGDTVCDPFLGSGTTMKVSDKLGRRCIGFEINKDAKEIILKKVNRKDVKIIE